MGRAGTISTAHIVEISGVEEECCSPMTDLFIAVLTVAASIIWKVWDGGKGVASVGGRGMVSAHRRRCTELAHQGS